MAKSGKPAAAQKPRVITTKTVIDMKRNGEKITMLTGYDYLVAQLLDQVGIEIILVGDSLSNVVQGNVTTLPVTLDDMKLILSCRVPPPACTSSGFRRRNNKEHKRLCC